MNGIEGDIIESGRNGIRIHGGRQEDQISGQWKTKNSPKLNKTRGCLRAFDTDMAAFKQITDDLTDNDPLDFGGKVTIKNDLKQKRINLGIPYKAGSTKTTYEAPDEDASDEEKQNFQSFVSRLLNQFSK
jgi:hypothetical protein